MKIKNKKRTIYFLISLVTIIAALLFLYTAIRSTFYVAASGSLDNSFIQIPDVVIPPRPQAGIIENQGTSTIDSISSSSAIVSSSSIIIISTSTVTVTVKPVIVAHIPDSYPSRLSIPRLNIDAHVQQLGITQNGSLGTPSNFVDVGWYALGTIPGNKGSAIIDGHVDNGLALAGVFKHLSSVVIGDNVYVTNYGGTTTHFIVTDIESYDYKNAPIEMIFNDNTGSYLKLITCGGNWVPGGRTYDRRIVVTAVLVI